MSGFLGSYLHSLDDKGRVSLPAPFRHGVGSDSFVMIQFHQDALSLFPGPTWSAVEEKLTRMIQRQPEARHYLLNLTAHARPAVPDSQGRILIPERLREGAGLGEEALIVGALNKIEIWDPDRFERDTEDTRDEFESLAASIFA